MIDPNAFIDGLQACDMDFFTGVPDSLLKEFCACLSERIEADRHVIAANEGNAVAMASGYHMATGRCAVVYLQNSGLGNTINPLTSIADSEVYQIPMLLVVGWRGEPGVKDEPQHVKQGRITPAQLELLEIPYQVVDAGSDAQMLLAWARDQVDRTGAPVALLVRSGTFASYQGGRKPPMASTLRREEALATLLELAGDAAIVSTTGKTSREVFELRMRYGQVQRDFLTVGGMGHTASIALGVALGRPDRPVVCIDGDGSVLMHMGALPIIGSVAPPRFMHVLLNNGAHESVGGQPTVALGTDFRAIALASGYRAYEQASCVEELRAAWARLAGQAGPLLLEVRIGTGSRADLGRPTSTPRENKQAFMQWVAR